MNLQNLKLSRRAAFKNSSALAASSLLSSKGFSAPRTGGRLAVIGGGMGGIASAWFHDGDWQVDLFEKRHKIGGHCDSVTVDYQGHPLTLDLGAQFFHPNTHPLYVTLLEELGLYQTDESELGVALKAPGSVSLFDLGSEDTRFVSTKPLNSPIRSINFALYSLAARELIESNASYEITIEQWLNSLRLTNDFKENLLLPWLSSLIGTTIENARRSSARSILQTFALAFPKNFLKGASTYNSLIGLQGHLDTMLASCRHVKTHTSCGVEELQQIGDQWMLRTEKGEFGPYDQVIINAQPQFSKHWLCSLSWAGELRAILDQYEYFDARIVIHTDPVFMHKDRRNWAVYNGGITGEDCEGSAWVGGIHEEIGGKKIQAFKSWAMRRDIEPEQVLAERRFSHPLITPKVIRAAKRLAAWQGVNGLWFAGQQTTGMDLQEAALFSASQVADQLSPESRNLARLRDRFAQAFPDRTADYALKS